MEKKSFWQSLRKNRWLASTGMLAGGALAVYGVWQMPSMNQYHMETLDTPIMQEQNKETDSLEGSRQMNGLELPGEERSTDDGKAVADIGNVKDRENKHSEEVAVSEQEVAEIPETEAAEQVNKRAEKKNTKKGETSGKKAEKEAASVEVLSGTKSVLESGNFDESAGLSWPIEGDIILNYDTEGVVYFQTLAQYKANPAIMIAGKAGDKVKASTEGIVEEIINSEETGITVRMSVGNSYEILYGQLKNLKVSKGDTVKEGAVIGTLAEPTDYFAVEGTNLYFQILQDGAPVNPLLLLK